MIHLQKGRNQQEVISYLLFSLFSEIGNKSVLMKNRQNTGNVFTVKTIFKIDQHVFALLRESDNLPAIFVKYYCVVVLVIIIKLF